MEKSGKILAKKVAKKWKKVEKCEKKWKKMAVSKLFQTKKKLNFFMINTLVTRNNDQIETWLILRSKKCHIYLLTSFSTSQN